MSGEARGRIIGMFPSYGSLSGGTRGGSVCSVILVVFVIHV